MTEPIPPDALRRLEKMLLEPGGAGAPEADEIGYRAVMRGWITAGQLEEAVAERRRRDVPLEQVLVERGWVDAGTAESLSGRAPRLRRYELESPIGEGALAIVYRAKDRELGRPVAVKVLKDTASLHEAARRRMRLEAQALARLSHANVVAVHDVGEEDGRLYLVMELVEGRSLRAVLSDSSDAARGERLRSRVELLEKVARGVHHANLQGIIHRDLKPENILVTPPGEPKVADFGLAHLNDSDAALTRSGAKFGTPLYMAPEQVEGRSKDVTPRTDVYALGAILYEILAGKPPHPGTTLADVFARILSAEPESPRKSNPNAPGELEAVALKALEKDPGRRYPTAEEFADDLRRYLAGEPVRARSPGRLGRLGRRIRRNPVAWAGGAAAALSLVLAVSLGLAASRAARADRDLALRNIQDKARMALDAALKLRRAGAHEDMRSLLPEMESAYREAAGRAPDRAEVEYWMGRFHRALLNDAEALKYQERALRKDPDFAPSLYEHAILTARRYGVGLRVAYEEAWVLKSAPRRAADVRGLPAPTPEEIERARPQLVSLRERVARDIDRLESFLTSEESGIDASRISAARGILAYCRARYDEAAEILRCVVREAPSLEEAWEALTDAYVSRPLEPGNDLINGPKARGSPLRNWDELERLYTEALSHDKGYVPHLLGRGDVRHLRARYRMGRGQDPLPDFAAAEEDMTAALKVSDTYRQAWMERGHVRVTRAIFLMKRGRDPSADFAAAEADLNEALLRGAGSNAATLRRRALTHLHRGVYRASRGEDPRPDFAAAQKDLDEALRIAPRVVAPWELRGNLATHRGAYRAGRGGDPSEDFARAEQDLGEALRLRRDFLWAWETRGRLRLHLALRAAERGEDPGPEFEAAEEDLAEAVRIDPDNGEGWSFRGRIAFERGRHLERRGEAARAAEAYAAAARAFEEAIQIDRTLEPSLEASLRDARAKAKP
jgi:tetratricopeptide (TPR) repeat protein/tRNA A-37 threonylcarbamoyl transferase component Bud32